MATPRRHDVHAKQRVFENFSNPVVAENYAENLACLGRDLMDVRSGAVALLQVGFLKPVDSGNGVGLRITRKPPGAYRTAYQVDRPDQVWHQMLQYDAIKLAEHQPLGAARGAGNGTDRRNVESVFTDRFKGTCARFEGQRERFHKYEFRARRNIGGTGIIRANQDFSDWQ